MATGASSSDAIAPTSQKHDVFLSFRGEDTRYGFVSHLYAALRRKKIKTYIDDSLERGHEISFSLMMAIQESKVAIIIFSENYASSSWCLDELVHILQCKERYGQIVLPVFYHVEPTHIRKQQGSFGKVFSALEERFKGTPEKVSEWRVALSTAVDISGWDSSAVRFEAELVEKIVDDATRKLNRMARLSDDFKGLVGIERRIEKIRSLLCINPNGVCIIGIWGMGGIGKTTLANVVFKKFSSEFEDCCFVANVREEWDKGLKQCLQNKLFSDLLEEENPCNVRHRLYNRKVFIVLDDVNDQEQIEHLVGDCRWFGDGSRIIVTTRDMQILRYIEADAIYKVEELDWYEALELFLLNAFKGRYPAAEYIKMSEKVLNYAEGVPLALKVIGTLLRCKEKDSWESELNQLVKQAPNEKIHNVLNVSYDGLHEKDQHIFLDIACFFNGRDRCYLEEIWNTCGVFAKERVDNLIEKSLVIIRDSNALWIHGLVQKMGWNIILSTKHPGKRSRLWIAQDVVHVLKNKTGTEEIQGIFLDTYHIEKVDLGPLAFKEMHNLRFLKIIDWEWDNRLREWGTKLHFPRGLRSLPSGLVYFEWHNYPLKSLPSSFRPQYLVELLMPNSKLEKLWNGLQHLGSLKHIDLSFSQHLTQIPDLSNAPKLESINLAFCSSLVHLPPLNFQNFDKHIEPENPWPFVFRRDPGTLNLVGCSSLKSLPNISGKLKYLNLDDTAVEELPASIWSLNDLLLLGLNDCKLNKNLPSKICKLKRLRYLSLSNCCSLNKVPETLPRNIVVLNLSGTTIEHVPPSIKHVSCLEELRLSYCKRLVHLSNQICKLKSLRHLDLCGCSKLKRFPKLWEPMGCLMTLDLRETGIIELPLSIEKMIGLRDLLLDYCGKVELFPGSLICITSLRKLSLANCFLFEIPDWFSCLCSLELLDLRGNLIERVPPGIKNLSRLIELQIRNCKNLKSLPELPLSLGLLDASGCTSLKMVSNSKNEPVQGCWNDYQLTHYKEFLFSNCSKLDQSAVNNIIIDSQMRILRTATSSISQPEELSHDKPYVSTCYPGNEIPKWFNCQSENSSLTIELPPYWHKDFIGFAFCAVITSRDCNFEGEPFEVKCKFYFETDHGKSRKFHFEFQENWENQSDLRSGITVVKSSEHVFMWHKSEDYHVYHDAVKASFDFEVLLCKFYNSAHHSPSRNVKVRRCGIRLLYLHDVEDSGIVDNTKQNGNSSINAEQTT